jgi:hypothetical protein
MRVCCPACNAEMSLDVLLGREADARAVAALLEAHLPLGDALVRYVSLFRPASRRLQLARAVGLLHELLADVQRGAITRKGRDWPAPHATWRAAIDTLLTKRDKGALVLPLTSHGLLYEVMCGLADKAEAQAEAEAEDCRRNRRGGSGTAAGPTAVAVAVAAPPPVPAPVPAYTGPSRAARELKARMQAALDARQAPPPETTTTPQEPSA